MADGYDFTEDDEEINAQREDAKKEELWDNLSEKAMAGALNSLNSRVSACYKQLTMMIGENDYVKTKDMLDALVMKDLSTEGWLCTFYNINKDAFLHYNPKSKPTWYDALSAELKKTYDAGLVYYSDVKHLMVVGLSLYALIQHLRLEDGFRLIRVKDNFESAGFDVNLYKRINNDVARISNLINREWREIENSAQKARKFINDNLGKISSLELKKGYYAARIEDYRTIYRYSGLDDSFFASSDGEHYNPNPQLLVKADVIDRYTYRIAQTSDLKDPMQRTINECKRIRTEDIAEAEKACTTQAAQFLCAAFGSLTEAISDFAEMALETYVNFKEGKDIAPYCFMKKLSNLSTAKPNYGFNPNTSDPWDNGTYYADIYREAAQAIGAHCRLFVYDHGATIA